MLRTSAWIPLAAVLVLPACGEPASPPGDVVAPLRAADLAHADVKRRLEAARALRGGGEEAARSVEALARALADPSELVRQAVAEALRDLGPRAAPARAALRKAFLDDDVYVRWHAAEALGRIGAAASPDLEALEARARDTDEAEVVRAASARAVERIRGK